MRCLGYALLVAAFAAVLAANTAGATVTMHQAEDNGASRVEHLLTQHDCWTGTAPADMKGKIPGHAVVETDERGPRYVRSQIGFDIWLEDAPGTLYGFCR